MRKVEKFLKFLLMLFLMIFHNKILVDVFFTLESIRSSRLYLSLLILIYILLNINS